MGIFVQIHGFFKSKIIFCFELVLVGFSNCKAFSPKYSYYHSITVRIKQKAYKMAGVGQRCLPQWSPVHCYDLPDKSDD